MLRSACLPDSLQRGKKAELPCPGENFKERPADHLLFAYLIDALRGPVEIDKNKIVGPEICCLIDRNP